MNYYMVDDLEESIYEENDDESCDEKYKNSKRGPLNSFKEKGDYKEQKNEDSGHTDISINDKNPNSRY